jgi:hypothetical protein
MNYIRTARDLLAKKIKVDEHLLDLYTLLVFITGDKTDLAHVHDAWAVWRDRTDPTHKSLIPFVELSRETQELDRKYVEAIRETANEIGE